MLKGMNAQVFNMYQNYIVNQGDNSVFSNLSANFYY